VTTTATATPRFHLSLNVSDLKRSVEFYRTFFGVDPAKHHDDYAKFELDDPPVVFSLVPSPPASGGSLSHLGLRVADAAAVAAARARLEAAGLPTRHEEGVVCGHARQTRCWVEDPDRNFWEVYAVGEETGAAPAAAPPAEPRPGPVVWGPQVAHALPEQIPHADDSVDEVRLEGTFNADLDEGRRARALAEAFRVLRPGGKVLVHALVADRPFPGGFPRLPGVAALVKRVPPEAEPAQALKAAGFVGLHLVKLSEAPWFRHDGVEMRELKLAGRKPAAAPEDRTRWVLYKGPFRQAADDEGNVYPRGRRVAVSAATWELLRDGPAAGQFAFLDADEGTAGPCGR
jgi:catechol 2,3-dioxygenase-like lactoylglutathione lyase family enzyme